MFLGHFSAFVDRYKTEFTPIRWCKSAIVFGRATFRHTAVSMTTTRWRRPGTKPCLCRLFHFDNQSLRFPVGPPVCVWIHFSWGETLHEKMFTRLTSYTGLYLSCGWQVIHWLVFKQPLGETRSSITWTMTGFSAYRKRTRLRRKTHVQLLWNWLNQQFYADVNVYFDSYELRWLILAKPPETTLSDSAGDAITGPVVESFTVFDQDDWQRIELWAAHSWDMSGNTHFLIVCITTAAKICSVNAPWTLTVGFLATALL